MTTIAFDGKILAADSMSTTSGIVYGYAPKIWRLKDGRWFAASGTRCAIFSVLNWLNAETEKPTFDDDDEVHGIIVDCDGNARELWAKTLVIYPCAFIDGCWAGGSGWMFAQSAMALGLNAIDAVEHAAKFDTVTGEEVNYVKVLDKNPELLSTVRIPGVTVQ